MLDGVKIDIYIENHFMEPTLCIEGINYTLIPHIIQAKQLYGRMKDWLQCRDMARMFFKDEDFRNMLNNNWKSSLRTEY
jgi:hypothetical protein